MKLKLVIWGQKDDKRVLIALSLRAAENKVDIYVIPEEAATEEFYRKLTTEWKNGTEVEMPADATHEVKDLTASGDILPDGVTTENDEIIQRAKTEWQFAVLSAKLSNSYTSELELLKDKIQLAEKYEQSLWNELKGFWEKIQQQINDKNLYSEHIDQLKKSTNELFDTLKEKRKEMDSVYHENSAKVKEEFFNILQDIEDKINKGLSLQPLFEELKKIQNRFRTAVLTNHDRKSIWDRLDGAFKTIKEKKYGQEGATSLNTAKERLDSRYNGLLTAISKMEKSIQFDKQELSFQKKKIDDPGGQLEVQIRQAKINIIEDRIKSKEAKHADMLKTQSELEEKKERMSKNEAQRAEKESAKKSVQEKIAAEIKAASEQRADNKEDLEKAAQMIGFRGNKQEEEPAKDTLLGAIGAVVGETLSDAFDTVRAVAEVVEDKIEDAIENFRNRGAQEEALSETSDNQEPSDKQEALDNQEASDKQEPSETSAQTELLAEHSGSETPRLTSPAEVAEDNSVNEIEPDVEANDFAHVIQEIGPGLTEEAGDENSDQEVASEVTENNSAGKPDQENQQKNKLPSLKMSEEE